jgi:hypothetical protein
MKPMRKRLIILAVGMVLASPAGAIVKSSSPAGFDVVETASVKASPQRAYAALREVGHWWDSEHSFSHSALNMRLELRAGGCWCETLPAGGGVQHMQVVFVDPGKTVILRGTLGPLIDQGLSGALTFNYAPDDKGTKITVEYAVGGYFSDTKMNWAAAVDGVLGAQVQRMARYIDTGRPDPPATK